MHLVVRSKGRTYGYLQGKLLRKLYDGFPGILDNLADTVVEKHQLTVEDLPSWEEGGSCRRYEAKLCRELPCGLPTHGGNEVEVEAGVNDGDVCVEPTERSSGCNGIEQRKYDTTVDLVCA